MMGWFFGGGWLGSRLRGCWWLGCGDEAVAVSKSSKGTGCFNTSAVTFDHSLRGVRVCVTCV